MRHLWSSLAGVVFAPVAWALIALGQTGSTRTISGWVEAGTYNSANLIEAAVYLAVAALLLGLLGTLRISPLGPIVAGLLLVIPYLGMFIAPFDVRDAVPDSWRLFGDRLQLMSPVENGTLFLIGTMLLVATLSWQRWQRWPTSSESGSTTSSEGGTNMSDLPTPSSGKSGSDTPAPSLGKPDSSTATLPKRQEGESPWSTPPKATASTAK